uniref:Uncharacterized protein n=1 Tax=Arundo donax TaxID=35708 RepID=A0A0A8YBD5_ARUDO
MHLRKLSLFFHIYIRSPCFFGKKCSIYLGLVSECTFLQQLP